MRKGIIILGVILVLLISSGCIREAQEPVACTEDAKICPDGSAVGRVPPDCEFAPCPKTVQEPVTKSPPSNETLPHTILSECTDGELKSTTCPDGVTTYVSEECVDGKWAYIKYFRDPCAPLPTPKIPSVPPAPKQLYITVGQSEDFTYWGHSIAINYTSAYPDQIVQVTVDGVEKTFQRGLSESPTGIYWKERNLSFVLKPVLWETRDGQRIPFYEKTWDTTELYFEAMISGVDLTGDDAEKRGLFK